MADAETFDWEQDDDDDDVEDNNHDEHDDGVSKDDEELNEGEVVDELLQEYKQWVQAVEKAVVGLEKKQHSLQSEWEKAQGLEGTIARAQLLVSNLFLFPNANVRTATVQDWENGGADVTLTVDPQYESASAEADALFAQARKLKRGSLVVQGLLEETEHALVSLKEAQIDLQASLLGHEDDVVNDEDESVDEGRFRLIQDRLKRTSKTTKFQVPSLLETASRRSPKSNIKKRPVSADVPPIRKLTSPGGCPVLVGRNRRSNEYLSFQVAKGKDIWMHARGCPGAHVLIQHRRGGPDPTDECLQFAANLAAFYSDARTERKAEVSAAEPKHLLKPRGAPLGAVKLREELLVLTGRPDDVPESLKLARDESGLSDEYRSTDKAKHRRRTQEVSKQNQAKKRAEQRAKRRRRADSS